MGDGGVGGCIKSFSCQTQLIKGVPKKNSLNLRCRLCLISLATNMLEGWDIIHLKGEIHSYV